MNNQTSNQAKGASQASASLIRVDQVPKLPHLTDQEKTQTQSRVQQLWDILNNASESDVRRRTAHQHLTLMSQQIMQAMRAYNEQNKTQQTRPQAPTPAPPAVQRSQTSPTPTISQTSNTTTSVPTFAVQPVTNSQLLPEVQQQLDAYQFVLPPAMSLGSKSAEEWLKEARSRLGSALQRMQQAKTQKASFQRHALTKQQQGGLTAADQATYNEKITQYNKFITESQTFLEKFRDQQTQFRSQRAQATTASATTGVANPQAVPPNLPEQQRPQAGPSTQVTPQPQTSQSQGMATVNSAATPQQGTTAGAVVSNNTRTSPVPTNLPQTQPQPQPAPTTPGTPQPNTMASMGVQPQRPQYPSHAGPAMLTAPGAVNQNPSQPSPNLQHHPNPGQMPRPTFVNGPNPGLQRSSTEPVLSAISGYVLDRNEEGNVLSKKKLQELVVEVLGADSDGLTADAEELCTQFVEDFVDDILSEGCKVAKMRGSQHLDARDIQVVLERQYNMRIPGYSTDELRVARRPQPALGWTQKTGQFQSSK